MDSPKVIRKKGHHLGIVGSAHFIHMASDEAQTASIINKHK